MDWCLANSHLIKFKEAFFRSDKQLMEDIRSEFIIVLSFNVIDIRGYPIGFEPSEFCNNN